jgi:hypothetical protein
MTENPSTRFVSIRLSPDEFKDVYQHLQESTCRSLTEYAKKLLTNKPVTVKVRDQAREDVLQQLTLIKTRLDSLLDQAPPSEQETLQGEITEIKSAMRSIAEKCSQ